MQCYTFVYISHLAEKDIIFFHMEEFAKRAAWKAEFLCTDT